MRMVNASVALLDEKDPFKKIERAGRICYKSEDKITEDSAKKFVETMIRSQHYAMLEHANFVFEVKNRSYFNILQTERFLNCTKELLPSGELRMLVSGNLRAINEAENAWQLAFVLAKHIRSWSIVRISRMPLTTTTFPLSKWCPWVS